MNLNQSQKQSKLNDIFEEIEGDMTYMGCSAIEDKLQDVFYHFNLESRRDYRIVERRRH